MESKICCYEESAPLCLLNAVKELKVPDSQKYIVDLASDWDVLKRTRYNPRIIILSNISKVDKFRVASCLARIYINYNPTVFCMDCDIEFMKYVMRYESLRFKMSDNTDIQEDIKQLILSVYVESDESYEF